MLELLAGSMEDPLLNTTVVTVINANRVRHSSCHLCNQMDMALASKAPAIRLQVEEAQENETEQFCWAFIWNSFTWWSAASGLGQLAVTGGTE